MPYVYLAHWQATPGGARTESSWDAPYPAFCIGRLDLRPGYAGHPIDRAPQGYGLFVYSQEISDPALFPVTTDIHQPITPGVKDRLKGELNVESPIRADKVKDVIWEIMTVHADPTGRDRVRPLMPKVNGMMELHLGGFSKIKEKRFRPFQDEEWDMVLANLQYAYRKLRSTHYTPMARLLQRPSRFHYRKALGGWMRQYSINNPRVFIPPDLPYEGWLEPETSLSDDFNRGDESLDAGNWTELVNLGWAVVSETAEMDLLSGALSVARYDTALSSGNHYSQVTFLSTGGNALGPILRKDNTATDTHYGVRIDNDNSERRLFKRVTGTPTNLSYTNPVTTGAGEDILRGIADGSTISYNVEGTEEISVSNADIGEENHYCGFYGEIFEGQGTAHFDDWKAADLAAGGPTRSRIGFGAGYRGPAA